jgi:GAF domain-containing protein
MSTFERLAELVGGTSSLEKVLQETVDLAAVTIPGATEVSVTIVRSGDDGEGAAYSSETAEKIDERQYGLDQGPCLDAARGHEVFIVDDMRTETRWPDYTPFAAEHGVLSSLSVPLPVQEEVLGAINVYSREPSAFGDEAVETARRFASYAAVAIANAHLYQSAAEAAEHMRRAMESRAVIEQAKGIVMAQRRCSAKEAFDLLVRSSQRENVKLRILAERIVEGVTK